MDPIDPETWKSMTRWERAELGRKLRRDGWTYCEIMEVLPVVQRHPGRLVQGDPPDRRTNRSDQGASSPSQKGIPKDTNWKRRLEIEGIRDAALKSFRRSPV